MRIHIGLALALTLVFAGAAAAQKGSAVGSPVDKVAKFLKASKYKSSKIQAGIWSVTDDKISVIATADANYVIVFALLAKRGQYRVTAKSMSEMLKYAGNADFIKIVIDDEGDLVLRIESKPKLMEQKDFEEMLDQVFAASIEAVAKLKPYIIK